MHLHKRISVKTSHPNPYQNVRNPEHWFKTILYRSVNRKCHCKVSIIQCCICTPNINSVIRNKNNRSYETFVKKRLKYTLKKFKKNTLCSVNVREYAFSRQLQLTLAKVHGILT
jgi:hypothetical protein